MVNRKLMPARDEAEKQDTDQICDLDLFESRKKSFKLFGRERIVKPVTMRTVVEFEAARQAYVAAPVEEKDAAYVAMVRPLCDDFTKKDSADMSVIQKTNLITHLTCLIAGKNLTAELEKKNLRPAIEASVSAS